MVFGPPDAAAFGRQARRIAFLGDGSLRLDAPQGELDLCSRGNVDQAGNAYRDNAGNWQRYDTALPAMLVAVVPATGQFQLYTAAAGANPITWTGPSIIPAVVYSSGEVSIAAAATGTFTHGLGAKPRFVYGYYTTTSGASSTKTAPVAATQVAGEAVPQIGTVSTTTISITNGLGVTIYAEVNAIL